MTSQLQVLSVFPHVTLP